MILSTVTSETSVNFPRIAFRRSVASLKTVHSSTMINFTVHSKILCARSWTELTGLWPLNLWQTRRMRTRRLQWMISSQQKMPSTQSSTRCEFCCFILVLTLFYSTSILTLYCLLLSFFFAGGLLLSEPILALNRLTAIYGRDLYGSYIMEGLRKWSPVGGLQMLRYPPYGLSIVRQTFMLTWWSKTISLSGIYIYTFCPCWAKHGYIFLPYMPCQVQVFDLLLEPFLSNRLLTERLLNRKSALREGACACLQSV